MSSEDKSIQTVDLAEELLFIAVKPRDRGEYSLSYGGYKKVLLTEQLSSRDNKLLVCNSCEGVLLNAISNQNGDVVCECCLSDPTASPLLPIRKVVSSLTVRCPQYFRGCEWSGVLSDIREHVDECGYLYTSCPLSCSNTMLQQNISEHVMIECIERIVLCFHCSKAIKVKDLTEHYGLCSMYLIECTNLCGVEMKRYELEDHLVNCPYRLVSCPYVKYGCSVIEILFCDLKEHLETRKDQHLSNLEKAYQTHEQNFNLKYQTAIRRVENENEKLKQFISPILTTVRLEAGCCQDVMRIQSLRFGSGAAVRMGNETFYINLVRERNERLYFVIQFPTPRYGVCLTVLSNQDTSSESIVFQPMQLDCKPLTPPAPSPQHQTTVNKRDRGSGPTASQSRIIQTTFYEENQRKIKNVESIQNSCFSVISSGIQESLFRFPFVKEGNALLKIGLILK